MYHESRCTAALSLFWSHGPPWPSPAWVRVGAGCATGQILRDLFLVRSGFDVLDVAKPRDVDYVCLGAQAVNRLLSDCERRPHVGSAAAPCGPLSRGGEIA